MVCKQLDKFIASPLLKIELFRTVILIQYKDCYRIVVKHKASVDGRFKWTVIKWHGKCSQLQSNATGEVQSKSRGLGEPELFQKATIKSGFRSLINDDLWGYAVRQCDPLGFHMTCPRSTVGGKQTRLHLVLILVLFWLFFKESAVIKKFIRHDMVVFDCALHYI